MELRGTFRNRAVQLAAAMGLVLMAAFACALPGKAFAAFPTFDAATEFAVNSNTPVATDVDKVLWYKVTPEQDGGLRLILGNNAASPASAEVWFAAGTTAADELFYSSASMAAGPYGGSQICNTGVHAGTDYYLAVKASAGADLRLEATFDAANAYEFEPDNSKETASSLSFDKPTTTGALTPVEGATDDVDWYTFAVEQVGTFTLNYKGTNNSDPVFEQPYDGDSRTITLYGSDGTTVISSVDYLAADEESGKDLVQATLAPGTYFVKIEKYASVSDPKPGAYTIRLQLSPFRFLNQPESTYYVRNGDNPMVTWDTNFIPTAIWIQKGGNNQSRWEGSKKPIELDADNDNSYAIRAYWGAEFTDEYIESNPFNVVVLDLGAYSLYLREGPYTFSEDLWLPASRLLAKANGVTSPGTADGAGDYDLDGDGTLDMKVEKVGADYKLKQLDTCSITSDYEIRPSDAEKVELENEGLPYWSVATFEPFVDHNIGAYAYDLAAGDVTLSDAEYSPLKVFLDTATFTDIVKSDGGSGTVRYDLDKDGHWDVKVTESGSTHVLSIDGDANLHDTTMVELGSAGAEDAQAYLTDFYDTVTFKMNPTATEPSRIECDPAKGAASWDSATGKLTVTPADGYEVDQVKVNGVVVAPDADGTYDVAVGDVVEIAFKTAAPPVVPAPGGGTTPGSGDVTPTTPGTDTPGASAAKPKATKLGKLTPAKKGFTAKWKKRAGVKGYQLQYSLKKNFKPKKQVKSVTVKKAKKVSVKVKKLKSKKTYYVRVRTFAKASSGKVYSSWSKVKKVTTR